MLRSTPLRLLRRLLERPLVQLVHLVDVLEHRRTRVDVDRPEVAAAARAHGQLSRRRLLFADDAHERHALLLGVANLLVQAILAGVDLAPQASSFRLRGDVGAEAPRFVGHG